MEAENTKNKKKNSFGIYAHIPFCRQKCFYCDFASLKAPDDEAKSAAVYERYAESLCQEIILYRELFPDIYIDTIYFGGGTPSVFPPELIGRMLERIKKSFAVSPAAEITLEANPGTVNTKKLEHLKKIGVNRLSFGVQAAQNKLLQAIGRIHTIEEADEAVSAAQKAGFSNISVDLMYGLPRQSFAMLKESAEWALEKNIQHISVYGLQVEEDTVFGRLRGQGKLSLPSEDSVEEMYDYLTHELPRRGYYRYEISNFALPGFESRHNLSYWQDKPYLGLGAGAHGYYELNGRLKRVLNPFDPEAYIKKCGGGAFPCETEEYVDEKAHMEEFCFLSLRTAEGIDKMKFYRTFGADIGAVYREKIEDLTGRNLIKDTEDRVFLTEKGMKFGNLVFEEFLL